MADLDIHKKRADRAWVARNQWQKLYDDCYEFGIPMRRPGGANRSKTQIDRLFDMTAVVSTFTFAGTLQQDLFPAGSPAFNLIPGSFVRSRLAAPDLDQMRRLLQGMADVVHPFFLTGEWDNAVFEMCLDLAVGTGGLYVAKGTPEQPVRFMSIPSDDLAVELGPFGDVAAVFWKQRLPRVTVRETFPEGNFPQDFADKLGTDPYGEIVLNQDFCFDSKIRRWRFYAWLEDSKAFVAENSFRTRPIATPRYYRVPGEAYGRGPLLLAMPSIKTANKAQELALKAAAIQMLGIWGYRAGGTFNPDTVRVGPGEFWPMMATGGVLGADVQRLDPASGRLDVARMVLGELQKQIRETLLDTPLPDPDLSPKSASEIVARLRQKKDAHLGAFGRLTQEIMPVVVPRAMEILYEFGYLDRTLNIDNLLIGIEVLSPMAQALKADRLTPIVNYFEMVGAMAGPDAVPVYLNLEKSLDLIADETQVPIAVRPTAEERQAAQKAIAEQRQAAMAMEAAATLGPALSKAA